MKQAALFFFCFLLSACGISPPADTENGREPFRDGYYSAEAADFNSRGWKEYISLYMQNGRITTVEYNAKTRSGFVRSWDNDYMRRMNLHSGTYPSKYARNFVADLLRSQNPDRVDAVSGATESHRIFKLLAKAAIENARLGIKTTSTVPIEEGESK